MQKTARGLITAIILGSLYLAGCFTTEGNVKTITFNDGSKYVGEVMENMKHGYGRMTWAASVNLRARPLRS